jgi:SAM-dependent methyltransferase
VNHLEHNRRAWNRESRDAGVWSQPVSGAEIAAARAGDWRVILTPKLPVPRAWFGDLRGAKLLCLASGGGQQVPILAAAGARVTSFDLSDEQLARDHEVAEREGLAVRCLRGDMADLSVFDDGEFDLVFQPAANVFVPALAPVWAGCHRVLRRGGRLLSGFMNPDVFLFDHDEAERTGEHVVRYRLPYSDTHSLPAAALQAKLARDEPLRFGHSLDTQIGGQLAAGFVLAGFYEDRWFDDSWPLAGHCPIAFATRADKPA